MSNCWPTDRAPQRNCDPAPMPSVTYRQHDGSEWLVPLPIGDSIMQGAVRNNMRGIDAECGGNCACATCHVYVDPEWMERIGTPSAMEQAMLMVAHDPRPTSRLSCQIVMTEALDGLVVEIPHRQR